MTDPNHPMNALMRLNQIHPGLQYRLLSQSGPVHAPVFTMSVDIQGSSYQATGNSKRTAKLQVALKVPVSALTPPKPPKKNKTLNESTSQSGAAVASELLFRKCIRYFIGHFGLNRTFLCKIYIVLEGVM